jgi:hypothetical protein
MRALGRAVGAMAAFGCAVAALPAARAGDIRITAPAASLPSNPADAQPDKPLTPEESAMLERALVFDPATLNGKPRELRLPSLSKPGGLAVNRTDKPDGSGTVTVKRPMVADFEHAELDASVGADVNLAAPPPPVYQPGKPLPGSVANDTGSAAAWASVGMPNLAAVAARGDPPPPRQRPRQDRRQAHALDSGRQEILGHARGQLFDDRDLQPGRPRVVGCRDCGAAAGYRSAAGGHAGLRQFQVAQVQHRADRHHIRRRRHHGQQ